MSLNEQQEKYLESISGSTDAPVSIKPNVARIKAESMTETKRNTMNQLLERVDNINLIDACKSLGWVATTNREGADNPPNQSHYKVAIIDQLMITAKRNNWHLALDAGLFYIYTGSMWVSLDKDELKNFLKDVAIKQGYPPH